MNIMLLEPFFTGSHKRWALGYQANSRHNVVILSLVGRHWKWRMHAGAVNMAEQFIKQTSPCDLIIASDMMDLNTFLSLTRIKTANTPAAIYFHENQITYPWSPDDVDVQLKRDNHYAFINYSSALGANKVFFNSVYHKDSFLNVLPDFLDQFPDHKNLSTVDLIEHKSEVLPLGMDLKKFDSFKLDRQTREEAVLLWNHRWEYDKNPVLFFNTLYKIKDAGYDFKLIILGEKFAKSPQIFEEAMSRLKKEILFCGYVESFEKYAELLWSADILPVSNFQDFFGGSVVEAIYCNCFPILPNRLAYPEHIPENKKANHFYKTDEEFYHILIGAIQNIKQIRQIADYQNFVSKYDWSKLASLYDSRFELLINIKDE